tara:strand:+ start:99 stop:431 length:333 start_codon:yes stop_codon:yes gene_type:complete
MRYQNYERQTWVNKDRPTICEVHKTQKQIEREEHLEKVCEELECETIYIEAITDYFWDEMANASLCESDKKTQQKIINAIRKSDFETIGKIFAEKMIDYANYVLDKREGY